MALTDTQCKKALPGERDYKLADGGGLHLFVTTKGTKSWRMNYRFDGQKKLLVFGRHALRAVAGAWDRRGTRQHPALFAARAPDLARRFEANLGRVNTHSMQRVRQLGTIVLAHLRGAEETL